MVYTRIYSCLSLQLCTCLETQEDHSYGNHGRKGEGDSKQWHICLWWLRTAIIAIVILVLPKELRRTLIQMCACCKEMDPLWFCHLFWCFREHRCFSALFLCEETVVRRLEQFKSRWNSYVNPHLPCLGNKFLTNFMTLHFIHRLALLKCVF